MCLLVKNVKFINIVYLVDEMLWVLFVIEIENECWFCSVLLFKDCVKGVFYFCEVSCCFL